MSRDLRYTASRRGNVVVSRPGKAPLIQACWTVDEIDEAGAVTMSVCSFMGNADGWCGPAAERVAGLLTLFGLVDEVELLLNPPQGETP